MAQDGISVEEKKKEWQERQERRDKLSNMMGQYLLKGYRMLDSYCPNCNNILMKTPGTGTDVVCIQCSEEADNGKDIAPSNRQDANKELPSGKPGSEITSDICAEDETVAVRAAIKALLHKLTWATDELEKSLSVEYSIQVVQLIQTIGAALKHLRNSSISRV